MPLLSRAAATAAALPILLAVAAPAHATAPSPSPSPTPSATPTVSAEQAQTMLSRQRAALDLEQSRLATSTATATAALQAYQQAQRAAEASRARARREAERLEQARRETRRNQQQVDAYAGSLYRTGMIDPRVFVVSRAVAAPDSEHFFSNLGMAEHVGQSQAEVLEAVATAEREQAAAERRSRAAAQQAKQASVAAADAKALADRVVADLQERVELRVQAVALTSQALRDAQHREAMLAAAERIARLRSQPPEAAVQGALVDRPEATCKGKSLDGYENGRLPADALCLLWGTYQHMLRADAAAAFDAMSHEYALTFGSPICVTDSYRSYEEQLAVKAAKPELAAMPGYSNHGWAIAVDLCDGVEGFDTPAHRWMQENSMRFGWFHPDWAQSTGSKPEPWHWEFAG